MSYHVVTTEGLHDRGFVEELDPLPQAGWFIDRLDSYACLRVSFDDVLGNSLVHHAEGALTQLSEHRDLLPGHLPLIRNIDYTKQTQITILIKWSLHKWSRGGIYLYEYSYNNFKLTIIWRYENAQSVILIIFLWCSSYHR